MRFKLDSMMSYWFLYLNFFLDEIIFPFNKTFDIFKILILSR